MQTHFLFRHIVAAEATRGQVLTVSPPFPVLTGDSQGSPTSTESACTNPSGEVAEDTGGLNNHVLS